MCKLKKYKRTSNTQIDKCMRNLIKFINLHMGKDDGQIVACCCGHGKYSMSILYKPDARVITKGVVDIVSGKSIYRTRKFYYKDEKGYYYIPEIENARK